MKINIKLISSIFIILILVGCKGNTRESFVPETKPTGTPEPSPVQTEVASDEPTLPPEEEQFIITEGVFRSIEWGDYLHLDMSDNDGNIISFFVLKYPGYDVETLEEGQRIKVYWQNVDVFLEAPQQIVNLNELVKLEPID